MQVPGAIETSPQTNEFGAALLQELLYVLPAIGMSPVAVALTQHDTRYDGTQPAVLMVLDEDSASTQLIDVARIGMSNVFNDVLPRVTPTGARTAAAPVAPAYAEPQQAVYEPAQHQTPAVQTAPAQTPAVQAPPAQTPPPEPAEAPPAAGSAVGAAQIWAAFEEAVRPQLGRGAAKAVEATRKGAGGMSETELITFLSERLSKFGAQTVEAFESALQG